jgi:hypothetical protein
MAVERERGISVSSAVMNFEHGGLAFNLLDTPHHQDLNEACRVPIAVGSADQSRDCHDRMVLSSDVGACDRGANIALNGVGDT